MLTYQTEDQRPALVLDQRASTNATTQNCLPLLYEMHCIGLQTCLFSSHFQVLQYAPYILMTVCLNESHKELLNDYKN